MFIKKNVEKWNEYQHTQPENPDEVAERFVVLVDDLSYAKTFYPQSKVTRWINGLAAGIYQSIYKNKKEKFSRVFSFWKYELPLLFQKYHRILFFCFIVFALFFAIGVFSSAKDETFIRSILGDSYVDMTEDNISKGDPFGVYRDENPFSMFVRIAVNNIGIAFFFVFGGLFVGIPTLLGYPGINVAGLWQTGLQVGCFQYMFFAKGVGYKSILVIWVHGTLEILSLVIAATAGLVIAYGILFPKTYSRVESLKRSVKDALKIMIILIPVFILAAFFESYVTHLMSNTFGKYGSGGLPVWAGILILITSLTFIAWYFIIYPIRLNKRGFYFQPNGLVNVPNE